MLLEMPLTFWVPLKLAPQVNKSCQEDSRSGCHALFCEVQTFRSGKNEFLFQESLNQHLSRHHPSVLRGQGDLGLLCHQTCL